MPIKPMIILIGSFEDLGLFGIYPDKKAETKLKSVWYQEKLVSFCC